MCCQLAHFICFFGNAYLLFDSVWCHHSSILLTTVVLAMKIHSTNWLRMNPWFFSSLSDHREFGSSVSSNFFHTSPNFSILSSYFKSFQLMVFWTRVQPQIRIWSSQVSFFFSPMWDSSFWSCSTLLSFLSRFNPNFLSNIGIQFDQADELPQNCDWVGSFWFFPRKFRFSRFNLIVGAFVTWDIYTQGQLLLWSNLIITGVVPGYK